MMTLHEYLFVEPVMQILAELTSAPKARHFETFRVCPKKKNKPLIFKQLNLTLMLTLGEPSVGAVVACRQSHRN
jgi:hypothetical protein